MTQPLLPFDAPTDPIQVRFELFHTSNPHIFEAFYAAALDLKRQGRKRYGAKAIYEHMRFHQGLSTSGGDFKLDNNFTSRYARLLLTTYPGEFDDFLELRKLKTEDR